MLDTLTDAEAALSEPALCAGCPDRYAPEDGWGGLCPSCCALLDDHAAGRHDRRTVTSCLGCLAGETVGTARRASA
ncbi:hypothetical protein [Solicola sp. PLA-1-18]|uniref:hypothetical protein n=1 Tax=Solicola sp. PLA-1-18 TaxID=3380532 RepID=UPI003B79C642